MKKKLLTAAAILFVLLLSFIGYLQIRQYNSYKKAIHKRADAIIRINADAIIQNLALDFLSNPADYWTSKKKGKPQMKSGIHLPANIFLYNVAHKSYDTFFCRLELSDSLLFKDFIRKKLGVRSFTKTNNAIIANHGTITVAYTADAAAIAFLAKKETVTDILLEILNGENVLSDSDPRMTKLKENSDHITYIQNNSYGGLSFKAGEILLQADIIPSKDFIAAEAVTHSRFPKESSVKMWLGANFKRNGQSFTWDSKAYTLHADSLLAHYKGYMEAALMGSVTQQDTAISYEYNDDFEKVETVSVVDKQVPGLYFSFRSNPAGLFHYLQNQKAIQADGLINKKLFPLYDLHTSAHSEYFRVSTAKQAADHTNKEQSPFFFFLAVDFDRLKKEKQVPLLSKYIETLSSLELKAQKKQEAIQLRGAVNFMDKETHAFRQIKGILGL